MELQAFVGSDEAETALEAVGVGASLVGVSWTRAQPRLLASPRNGRSRLHSLTAGLGAAPLGASGGPYATFRSPARTAVP